MIRTTLWILSAAAAICAAPVVAEEPPDDDIVQELLEDPDVSEWDQETAIPMLQAKWAVEAERLSRSGATTLRVTEKFAPHLPESERYWDVFMLDVNGESKILKRPVPPEEVQRRKMEASGLSPAQMADAARAYAAGAVATGEVLRSEMRSNPFGAMMMDTLGYSETVRGGRGVATGMGEGADVCEYMLLMAADTESRRVSEAGDSEYEVQPWTSINPVTFMMGPACMMLYAAEILDEVDSFDEATKRQMADALEAALAEIAFAGVEQAGGRDSYRLRIDDLDMVQQMEPVATIDAPERRSFEIAGSGAGYRPAGSAFGSMPAAFRQPDSLALDRYPESADLLSPAPAVYYYDEVPGVGERFDRPRFQRTQAGAATFTINSVDLWIDSEYLVDRKMRMEGVMTENGQSKDIFLEQEYLDYRNVPDSALYEPYRHVMRAGGMLTEAQQAELAEAQEKLAEFEQEMANMPPEQRAMMERMMGGQMDQMRSMVNSGTFEFETITTNIEINPDYRDPMLEEFARQNAGGSASRPETGNLVQIIQVDLTTLGYQPGNTDGELDTMTQVAISQFEAESGMTVTGEPSQSVADALARALGR